MASSDRAISKKTKAGFHAEKKDKAHTSERKGDQFPIVGLGASAGGLESLQGFFTHMKPDSGLSFVVVTHQHPDHVSILPELLARCTAMPVATAQDNMKLEPDRVYVGPPGENLAIIKDKFQLMGHEKPSHHLPLPIDYFFRSLADEKKELAIGIILSGTGTDGTMGIKAIRAATGLTLAQEPKTAKYSGMPASAIATGEVDYVLPVAKMCDYLIQYAKGPLLKGLLKEAEEKPPALMEKIFILLRNRTGHDFSAYKPSTLQRRIERRMNIHQIEELSHYVAYLRQNPHEVDILFKELLIRVTGFFRDPQAFKALAEKALPRLIDKKPQDSLFRVWVPGCCTGDEAYSIAILLEGCQERLNKRLEVQIFATDLDEQAIETARQGVYPLGIAADVKPDYLERYFIKEDNQFRVRKEIRDQVVFACQNLIKDPPFTRLDLLSCRNLLIYLNSDLQKHLLPLFHYVLKPDGVLFLGTSESIGSFSDLFAPLDAKWKIFRRKKTVGEPIPPELPSRLGPSKPMKAEAPKLREGAEDYHLTRQVEKWLLQRFAPVSAVVNERGGIIYIHGRTGLYLEPTSGRPSLNIIEMAREGLRLPLTSLLKEAAAREDEKSVRQRVRVKTNGGYEPVVVEVSRIIEPETLRGLLMVNFHPVAQAENGMESAAPAPSPEEQDRVQELERELQYTRESLQTTIEELESSNEELKSTNEELQSTNEELQSANEELETSREEMQSLNEELNTVNAELQSKLEELSQANDDMQNLLNSTGIATIFLDRRLCIKRFTPQAKKVIKFIDSDVGRAIGDLASKLKYGHLEQDGRAVLQNLVPKELEVQTHDGAWYFMRIAPYRTAHNVIDGLVITFVDIDRLKEVEKLAEAGDLAKNVVETVRHPLLVLDENLRVIIANPTFYKLFRLTPEEVEQQPICQLSGGAWDIPRLRELFEKVLSAEAAFDDFKVEGEFPFIGHKVMLLNARRLQRQSDEPTLILLAIEEVSERHGS